MLGLATAFFLTTTSCGLAQEPVAQEPAARTPEEPAATAAASASPAKDDSSTPATSAELSKAEARIANALNSVTSLEFLETPLTDVAAFISDQHGIAVQLDTRALEDSAIPTDLPITFEASRIKLRSALALMLGKHDLGIHYRHEALFITTVDVLMNTTRTRVYPIYDLLDDDPDGDGDAWVDIIHTTIIPEQWDANGGPGAVEFYRGRLVVTQTDEVQALVQSLLAGMRKYYQAAQAAPGKPLPTVFQLEQGYRTSEAWNAILAKELDLEFVETPLSDVVQFLSHRVEAPVLLDERALEDSAIPFDLAINYQQRGVSLRAALAAMLSKHDLKWVIKHDVLLITTKDAAANEVFTRIYPVADLVRTSDGNQDWQLIEVMQMTVLPESWDVQGGPGAMTPSPDGNVLIITQTQEAHQEIEALFVKLRKAAAQDTAGAEGKQMPVKKPDHSRNLKVFEQFGGMDFAPLAEVAREMFEPNRWPASEGDNGASPVLAAAPGQLIVRHEKSFIDLIDDFLGQAYTAGSFSQRRFERTPVFELGESGPLMVRCYRLPPIGEGPGVGGVDKPAGAAKADESPKEVPRPGQPYEPLVRELVLPDSWGEAGPGRVRGLPGLLVVRHTPQGQQEVVKLLEKLIGPPGAASGGNFF